MADDIAIQVLVDVIYTTKIVEFVCPPHISETVGVRIMKLPHRPDSSKYCLDNDQTRFKINLNVHFLNFIKNNSANRRYTPNIAQINMMQAHGFKGQFGRTICELYYFLYLSVSTLSPYVGYSYSELNCDGLHILISLL